MSDNTSQLKPVIVFYVATGETSIFPSPSSIVGPIEISNKVPFVLKRDTPIFLDEVFAIHLDNSY
jgi:hypothetical protein